MGRLLKVKDIITWILRSAQFYYKEFHSKTHCIINSSEKLKENDCKTLFSLTFRYHYEIDEKYIISYQIYSKIIAAHYCN